MYSSGDWPASASAVSAAGVATTLPSEKDTALCLLMLGLLVLVFEVCAVMTKAGAPHGGSGQSDGDVYIRCDSERASGGVPVRGWAEGVAVVGAVQPEKPPV